MKTQSNVSLSNNLPQPLSPDILRYPPYIDLDDASPPMPNFSLPELPHRGSSTITCNYANCFEHGKIQNSVQQCSSPISSPSARRLYNKTSSSSKTPHAPQDDRVPIGGHLEDITIASPNLEMYLNKYENLECFALALMSMKPARGSLLDAKTISILATI